MKVVPKIEKKVEVIKVAPKERLTKQEVRELTKLRRRYGWQPSGFTQKKASEKPHELVDDAESSQRLNKQICSEMNSKNSPKQPNRVD